MYSKIILNIFLELYRLIPTQEIKPLSSKQWGKSYKEFYFVGNEGRKNIWSQLLLSILKIFKWK